MLDFQHWPEATGFLGHMKRTNPSFRDVASTPFEILAEAGSLQLRKYRASTKTRNLSSAKPILILPSVINQSYVLDLLPEKSLIQNFLSHGHDVYMIDWGVPKSHESQISFETLLTVYVDYLLQFIEHNEGHRQVHVVGHCLGGTIGLILSNLKPERFLSLMMITAPVNFESQDKLSRWARYADFDVDAFTDAYGNAPWALLQSAFLALKPTQILSKCRHYLSNSQDSRYVRNFWAMESWSNDNVNLRGACFRLLIEDLYRNNSLEKGHLRLKGKVIDLRQHKIPTFVLMTPHDHIVPVRSHLTQEMVPGVKNFEVLAADGGHVGVLIGGRAQKIVWPKLTEWIKNCEV